MPASGLAGALERGVTAAVKVGGMPVTFVRRVPAAYNPVTGTAGATEIRLALTVASETVRKPVLVGQTLVQVGDRWLLVPAAALQGLVPQGGDVFALGGVEHRIGPVEIVPVQGVPVLYRCLIRGPA